VAKYDPKNFTFGLELELGDVRRDREIPKEFGTWEYAERDILNLQPPYALQAADPEGLNPPVGGEINVYPAKTPLELAGRTSNLLAWFRSQGDTPCACCMSHTHVHIRVPGLCDDIEALKWLTQHILMYQNRVIKEAGKFVEDPLMKESKSAKRYLKWDGGRPMPYWMGQNIINYANDFDDFIRIQCCGKDAVSRGRPFRYAINTYCMKHTDTIEFRMFRPTLDPKQFLACFMFVQDFIDMALNTEFEFISPLMYSLPPFTYNHEHYLAYERTRKPDVNGSKGKRRTLIEI
jgi:hypothetical protein